MYRQTGGDREVFGDGANLLVCGSVMKLPPEIRALAGKVQCVYLDPPFMTGKNFSRKRAIGEKGWRKGKPVLTLPGFEDSFEDERLYLKMLRRMIAVSRELLKNTGVFYLHLDWRMNAQARMICDRVFGRERFLNEIIWAYESGGRSRKFFPRKHDTILMYAGGDGYQFDITQVPLPRTENRKNHMARGVDEDGRMYASMKVNGKEYRYYDDEPVYPGDVWTDIGFLQQRDPERTGYSTQKPEKLLKRLLSPVVQSGDLVSDLCCGSGTTLAAAQELGCRFAGMDISPAAIAVTLNRLNSENLTVICPCEKSEARLIASYDGERLRIEGLEVPDSEYFADRNLMDVLESWEIGRMERGTFIAEKSFRRSFRFPALTDSIKLPADQFPRAIMTTDASGARRLFQWKD